MARADLPAGRFTHFRITLTHLHMEVDVSLHGVPVLGEHTTRARITYGLAPVTIDDRALAVGDAIVTGSVFGNTFVFPHHVDPIYPSPGPGASAALVDGATRVTFMLTEPLVTSPQALSDLVHVCRFGIAGSFRWVDTPGPGHRDDRWDVDIGSGVPAAEHVVMLGATGFTTRLEQPDAP